MFIVFFTYLYIYSCLLFIVETRSKASSFCLILSASFSKYWISRLIILDVLTSTSSIMILYNSFDSSKNENRSLRSCSSHSMILSWGFNSSLNLCHIYVNLFEVCWVSISTKRSIRHSYDVTTPIASHTQLNNSMSSFSIIIDFTVSWYVV